MNDELWHPIRGFPNYEVCASGKVRSLTRRVNCRYGATRVVTGKLLSVWACKSTGYAQVMLSDRKKHNIHRLVAEAFLPNLCGKPQVNHLNGIRHDGRVENLEWVTASENARHSFHSLGRRNPSEGRFGGQHPTSKAVISRCRKTGLETRYESAMDAVRQGFDSGSISRCVSGQAKTHKGHQWRYASPQGAAYAWWAEHEPT